MDYEQISRLTRINVVGTSGSGKSTFARQLAKLLDLPCYEMDALFWKASWQQSSDDELFAKIAEATSGSRWVLDGNYTRTLPVKWKTVQLVIWLDLSLVTTVFRVTRRTIGRSLRREEIWPGTGNRESLRMSFLSPDSVIWWAIRTHRRNRIHCASLSQNCAYEHITFVRLRSSREIAAFLDGLRQTEKAREVSAQNSPTISPP